MLLATAMPGSGLVLNLVHNPVGAFLPPPQAALEADFRRVLDYKFGIQFNHLYCITNMPISRFLEFLLRSGNYEQYMEKLAQAFNPRAVAGLMCRNTISVGWDGRLYDCDFNQMLDLEVGFAAPRHLSYVRYSGPESPPDCHRPSLSWAARPELDRVVVAPRQGILARPCIEGRRRM